ncbi:MAG: transporter substrate-binding domain-containing protein [Bacteroidota bacterium]
MALFYFKKYFFLILLIHFFFSSCSKDQPSLQKEIDSKNNTTVQRDLNQIKQSGVLKAITTYSPTSYFLYRGETLGFEYELLNRFAKNLGVKLEVVIAKNVDSLIPMLNRGEGDVIATGYTITSERKKQIRFTDPYLITHQTLVQKKPENWRKLTSDNIKQKLVLDIVDLIGDTVSVRRKTSFYNRLVGLNEELGDTIYINILPGFLTEDEIIKLVNDGKIKYTIADYNIAYIHKSYYPDIDVSTPVSLSQRIAWAVRKNSPNLLDELNEDLKKIKKKSDYNVIYKKYFNNRTRFKKILNSEYFTSGTGKISKYDNLVKKYATETGWDWRLVKSIIYQESRFDPTNNSWAGAGGLMQIMPNTAKELGLKDVNHPEENIKAGIKYLHTMYNNWEQIPDSIQRIKFALASYNCGYGHVLDAQKLTKKFNKDPYKWDNGVDEFILKLSKPKYFNDDVVRFGYVRGREPFYYVIDIFDRFETYKKFTEK